MTENEDESPIDTLREMQDEESSEFLRRVRGRIDRRRTSGQFVSFSFQLPKLIFIEMLGLFGHSAGVLGSSGRKSK